MVRPVDLVIMSILVITEATQQLAMGIGEMRMYVALVHVVHVLEFTHIIS